MSYISSLCQCSEPSLFTWSQRNVYKLQEMSNRGHHDRDRIQCKVGTFTCAAVCIVNFCFYYVLTINFMVGCRLITDSYVSLSKVLLKHLSKISSDMFCFYAQIKLHLLKSQFIFSSIKYF